MTKAKRTEHHLITPKKLRALNESNEPKKRHLARFIAAISSRRIIEFNLKKGKLTATPYSLIEKRSATIGWRDFARMVGVPEVTKLDLIFLLRRHGFAVNIVDHGKTHAEITMITESIELLVRKLM